MSRMNVGGYDVLPSLRGLQPGYTLRRTSGPKTTDLFQAKSPPVMKVLQGRRVAVPQHELINAPGPEFQWFDDARRPARAKVGPY